MNTGNSMGYDICKKAILLIVVGIVVVVSSVAQEVVNNRTNNKRYNLTNTYWAMKVENCCSNYYHFNKHGSYVYYSGEQDEYCPGVFSIKKDTLFLHEFYADEDGDGYGNASISMTGCSPWNGYVADSTDCNDDPSAGPDIHPAAQEICNELDDDCDMVVDEEVKTVFYEDADEDSYGNALIIEYLGPQCRQVVKG